MPDNDQKPDDITTPLADPDDAAPFDLTMVSAVTSGGHPIQPPTTADTSGNITAPSLTSYPPNTDPALVREDDVTDTRAPHPARHVYDYVRGEYLRNDQGEPIEIPRALREMHGVEPFNIIVSAAARLRALAGQMTSGLASGDVARMRESVEREASHLDALVLKVADPYQAQIDKHRLAHHA